MQLCQIKKIIYINGVATWIAVNSGTNKGINQLFIFINFPGKKKKGKKLWDEQKINF